MIQMYIKILRSITAMSTTSRMKVLRFEGVYIHT